MRTRGVGVIKSKNFADVINGCSLTCRGGVIQDRAELAVLQVTVADLWELKGRKEGRRLCLILMANIQSHDTVSFISSLKTFFSLNKESQQGADGISQ